MKTVKKVLLINLGALLCAVWFLAFSWVWTYLINVIVAFPAGVAAFFLWKAGRSYSKLNLLNKAAGFILVLGIITSIVALFIYK